MQTPKGSKSQLKRRCDKLASAYYRREWPFCELQGKDTINCGGPLQWMHIVGRANLRLRYEPFNKLIGCAGHHVWYTHNPDAYREILRKWFPDRLAEAEAHRNEYVKIDYEAWIEHFQASDPTRNLVGQD